MGDIPASGLRVGALFVDFESIYYALINHPMVRFARESALSASVDALNVLRNRLREDRYALIIERSYADWERISLSAQRQLQIYGLMPRFVDSRTDKNTADIELSLDILEYMLTRTELQHIVLVGGDRDYLPILRRIKEQHRSVQICSLRSTLSGDVREFAQNYTQAKVIELDTLIEWPGRSPEDGPPPSPSEYRKAIVVSQVPSAAAQAAAIAAVNAAAAAALAGGAGGAASAIAADASLSLIAPAADVPLQTPAVTPIERPASGVVAIERPGSGAVYIERPSSNLIKRPVIIASPRPLQVGEWHERYLSAMVKFMTDNGYQEIHLGPFFRWLRSAQLFDLVSTSELKRVFDELVEAKAVTVEERDTGQGYSFSVAHLNWAHDLSQKVHAQLMSSLSAQAATAQATLDAEATAAPAAGEEGVGEEASAEADDPAAPVEPS